MSHPISPNIESRAKIENADEGHDELPLFEAQSLTTLNLPLGVLEVFH